MGCGASKAFRVQDAATKSAELACPCQPVEGALEQGEDWSWTRDVLERYTVRGVDVLGIGSFSIVRRGTDKQDGQAVAVKCLKDGDDAKFRREVFLFQELFDGDSGDVDGPLGAKGALWKRSATLASGSLSSLARPESSLVRLLGHSPMTAFARGEPCYCVLELGLFSLNDLRLHCAEMARKGKPHSLAKGEELLRAFLHILRALAFLHSRFFIHGDLKPANVMWFGGGARQDGGWRLIDVDGLLTTTQLVDMRDADFYTPIYAAPEIAAAVCADRMMRVSRRLDVWSVGVVLMELELLTPPLWSRYEACCADGDDQGETRFLQWLAETPTPIEVPSAGQTASAELLGMLREALLVKSPLDRSTPQELLAHPYLSGQVEALGRLPQPSVEEPPEAPKAKPKNAFQLFQDLHREEVQAETGLKAGRLMGELAKRWKQAQAENWEEVAQLKQQERDLAKAFAEAEATGGGTAAT